MNTPLPGIDWTPFDKFDLSEADKKRLLISLTPIVETELKAKVQSEFTPSDIDKVNVDDINVLEETYHQKTGRYFLEELRLLLNQYIKNLASVFTTAKQETEALANLPQEQRDQLQTLLTEKKWEEAVKFLDSLKS